MDAKLIKHEPSRAQAKLGGAILALTVLTPELWIPGFIDRAAYHRLSFSWWILLPALGAAVSAWLIFPKQKRIQAAFSAALVGCCTYWSASLWASGSRHTSGLEIIAATLVGGFLPVLLIPFLLRPRTAFQKFATAHAKVSPRFPRRPATRGFLVMMSCAFAALTAFCVHDLNNLERHQPPFGPVFGPVASIYDRFGYWPAVLTVPGLFLFLLCCLKWRDHSQPPNFEINDQPSPRGSAEPELKDQKI